MREIKCKAFIPARNEWWELAGFVVDSNKSRIRLFRMNDELPDGMGTEVFDRDEVELVEWTGLKDKNGVEIYEGDLLKWRDSKHVLEVRQCRGGWNLFSKLFSRFGLPDGSSCSTEQMIGYVKNSEIIGNLHESPELLNEPS